MVTGTIFNIQRYSLHDGPGIRTTLFLKGCPLQCWWCHNPEGISLSPELIWHRHKCLGCTACVRVCPRDALFFTQAGLSYDREKCDFCSRCVEECPAEAVELAGQIMTPLEVMAEVEKDRIFFKQSGGGVTISGGEPLAQPQFLMALLKLLKSEGIHTAVDTSGYGRWHDLEQVSHLTDLFLFDLKLMDDRLSRKFTGKSNHLILENLRKLARKHDNIQIRVPLIPGVNDDAENLKAIGQFVRSLGINKMSIHPYHHIGSAKYEKLGRHYRLPHLKPPAAEDVARARECLERQGLIIMK